MTISVIVTTYNRADALKKSLEGVIHQTRKPDEIIVADDGSGPDTLECLRPYLDLTGVKVRHVWQEGNGFRLSRIRNKSMSASKGDYFIFLDKDCLPEALFIGLSQKGFFFQGKQVLVHAGVEKELPLVCSSGLKEFSLPQAAKNNIEA